MIKQFTSVRILAVVVMLMILVLSPTVTQGQDNELRVAVAAEMQALDFWRGQGINCNGCLNIVEKLITRDFSTGDVVPQLAVSWERLDDTTIQFQLREGVTFHDGSPFNAEAVEVNINYVFDQDNGSDSFALTSGFLGFDLTAEAVDEYTVNITSSEPDPIMLEKLYFIPMGSAQQILEAPDTLSTQMIGTGPYIFEEWARGVSLSMVANPDWWGHNNSEAAGGSVSFDRVVFRFMPEDSVRAAAVRAGEVHIAQFVTPEQCSIGDSEEGIHCEFVPSVETLFVRHGNQGLFSDIRLRQALSLAIDKELIVEVLLGDAATITGQIVNQTATGYNPEINPVPYDPDQARALIEEARADGVDVDQEFILASRQGLYAGSTEVVQAIEAMLDEVGFNSRSEFLPLDTFNPRFSQNWSATVGEEDWVAIHLHGNEILDAWFSFSSYFTCDGGVSQYCNPEMDALWEEARNLVGEEREQKLQEANMFAYEDAAYGLIAHLDLAYLVSDDISWDVPLDHIIHAIAISPQG